MKRSTLLWIIGGFVGIGFLVYGASLTNAFVRWDDGLLIFENPAIRSITPHTLKTIFTTYDPELYIPLTFFTYQIDYLMGGIHPAIYHFQNLLWHIANALLIVWFMTLLCQSESRSPKSEVHIPVPPSYAILAGLLFLLHPLHTEAVAWASARKDVVSTFFFLASVIAYLRWRSDGERRIYILSIVSFFLGLLAKVTVLTLPVVLLLLDFREGRKWSVRMFTEKIPYACLSIVFGIIAWIGKVGVLGSSTVEEKILMAPRSAIFYLEKLFLPIKLSVLYPFSGDVTLTRPDIAVPLILCFVLSIITFLSLRWTRNFFFGIAFFLLTVSPTLGNFAKGDFFYFASDRYAYLPSIGIFFLVLILKKSIITRWPERTTPIAVVTAAIVTILGFMAFQQSLIWKDSPSLFGNVLALYPTSYVAENNLGNYWRTTGDTAKALESYSHALRVMEEFGRSGPGLKRAESKTLANIASLQRSQGNVLQAKSTLAQALALNPENEYALQSLGIIAQQEGRAADAESFFRQAITSAPAFAAARLNLGALLVAEQRLEEGRTAYREALAINPFFSHAHYNLGVVLEKLQRPDEAMQSYAHAITLEPTFTAARINLGILLYGDQRLSEAKQQFQAILQYDPGNTQARSALQQMKNL